MKKYRKLISSLLAAALFAACGCVDKSQTENATSNINFPIPANAHDVRHYDFKKDKFKQTSFYIETGADAIDIIDFYAKFFTQNGWQICFGRSKGEQKSFIDQDGERKARRSVYFINYKLNAMIIVLETIIEDSSEPIPTKVFGDVAVYDNSAAELTFTIKTLPLTCSDSL